eukprot:11388766-Ditylum_brightwellii.AAC.2
MNRIAQKNKELENWRVSFDKTQQERFNQLAENVAKQLYEHSEEIHNKLESHQKKRVPAHYPKSAMTLKNSRNPLPHPTSHSR